METITNAKTCPKTLFVKNEKKTKFNETEKKINSKQRTKSIRLRLFQRIPTDPTKNNVDEKNKHAIIDILPKKI